MNTLLQSVCVCLLKDALLHDCGYMRGCLFLLTLLTACFDNLFKACSYIPCTSSRTWLLLTVLGLMGCLLLISGHVTLQFKDKLYLIGGRSSDIQSYNLENTERNADVWYTADGGTCYYSFK